MVNHAINAKPLDDKGRAGIAEGVDVCTTYSSSTSSLTKKMNMRGLLSERSASSRNILGYDESWDKTGEGIMEDIRKVRYEG